MTNEVAGAVDAALSEALQDPGVAEEVVLGYLLADLREICRRHGVTRELPTLDEAVQRWRETADLYAAFHGDILDELPEGALPALDEVVRKAAADEEAGTDD
jgi:hypothetical protein